MINNDLDKLGILTGESLADILKIKELKHDDCKSIYFNYNNKYYKLVVYYEAVKIWDLTEAGKIGKTVNELTLYFNNEKSKDEILYTPFANFEKILDTGKIGDYILCSDYEKIEIYIHSNKAINFLGRKENYKKLSEIPQKINKQHVIRALMNNQFKNLKCDGYYTDDYYWDAQVNYQKGEIKDINKFCQKLLSNDGWRIYKDSENHNIINVDCYHFDNNSFELVI